LVTQKVLNKGLGQAVIMTGSIAHTDVPATLSVADVAVVPSAPVPASQGGTGTPLKLFEFMAAGKAIVATALDQNSEVIEDGHNGLLIQPGDVAEFAQAMFRLLDNAAERGRLGQNARQYAVEHCTWEKYTRRLEETYLSVLSEEGVQHVSRPATPHQRLAGQ
jgi:glycosyltransferase involved in cell wall biosynthesis